MLKTTELTCSISYTRYSLQPEQYFGFKVGNQKFCSIVVKYDRGETSHGFKKVDSFTGLYCERD